MVPNRAKIVVNLLSSGNPAGDGANGHWDTVLILVLIVSHALWCIIVVTPISK